MIKVNSHYTIFTGILEMRPNSIRESELLKYYQPWENRIFEGNYQTTLNHLRDNYYDSFLLGMLPGLLDNNTKDDPKYLRRYTKKQVNHPQFNIEWKGESFLLKVEYFDLYFFPNGLAVFFFHCQFDKIPSLKIIPDIIYQMRKLSSMLKVNKEQMEMSQWIALQIKDVVKLDKNWATYIPQLKSYNIIDLNEEIEKTELDLLLYDLGTLSPIGTAAGSGMNSPSKEYYEELMRKHKISVFNNWSAISLFDTFTMISMNKSDPYKLWEYDYFNVYLMAIYIKGFIYLANTTLSDVTVVNRKSELIKNTFIEFINDYYISNISYRFLPNILNDKMIQGMDIEVEINKMEGKINRLNETLKRNRDNRLNISILILAIFSIFSVITDLSDWLNISLESKSWLYPWAGLIALIVLIFTLFVAINYSKFKRND